MDKVGVRDAVEVMGTGGVRRVFTPESVGGWLKAGSGEWGEVKRSRSSIWLEDHGGIRRSSLI